MEDKSLKELHLGLRMTALIIAVSLILSMVALWIGTRIYDQRNNEFYRYMVHNIGSSIELLGMQNELDSIISDVKDIYLNAPEELRDYDDSGSEEASCSDDTGEYVELYDEVMRDGYIRLLDKLNSFAERNDTADIFIWFPDYERHRMVFVIFGSSEKYRNEYEPAGFWIEMFEDDEEYTKNPDPEGHFMRYMRNDETTGDLVKYVQCTLPLYPDDTNMEHETAFVTVDVEWNDVSEQTVGYLKTFLLYMGIITVILTAVSQLVLRYSIVLPLKKVTAEQERIATELSLGADIQKSMLPESVPRRFGKEGAVSVYGFMEPAKETGGDFFDYFLLDDDHLALVIADVSGKGVPAALFMMMCQIFIDSFAANGYSPGEALARANDEICSRNRKRMFVTVWLGVLELSSGRLTAANAGHEYPVIRRDGGDFEIISDPHGLMAGCFKGTDYESYDIQLDKGDVLFVHTDGLTEATNTDKKLLGAERMVEALNELPADAEPETVCIHMKETVERFAGDTPQYDDLTMLCVRMEK